MDETFGRCVRILLRIIIQRKEKFNYDPSFCRTDGNTKYSVFECIIYAHALGIKTKNNISYEKEYIRAYAQKNLDESQFTMKAIYDFFQSRRRASPFDGAFLRMSFVLQANAYNANQPNSEPYVV